MGFLSGGGNNWLLAEQNDSPRPQESSPQRSPSKFKNASIFPPGLPASSLPPSGVGGLVGENGMMLWTLEGEGTGKMM